MTEQIFKHRKHNLAKLKAYGFDEREGAYVYHCLILDEQMALTVSVNGNEVQATVTDNATDEPYILHLVPTAAGPFVGQVREAYETKLTEIAESCFDPEVFKGAQTKRIIRYFAGAYGNELEYLWADSPDCAVVRCPDSRKWYAVVMVVSKRKLGLPSDTEAEILNLHVPDDVLPELVDGKRIFPAYHMSKKHWITVLLDDSVDDEYIFGLVNQSYALGSKTKKGEKHK